MTRTKKNLGQWEKEVDGLLLDIRKNFIRLGEIMFFAHQDLTAEDYVTFMKHIHQWGLRDADMKAAKAAFLWEHPDLGNEDDQRINPTLLFAGAKNSKILFMDKQDQERLLSGEKFRTVMSNGKVDREKSWNELSDPQRNMLIGKGGNILTVAEQKASLTGRKTLGLYQLGSIELVKGQVICTSRENEWKFQTSIADFAKMVLADDGFWEDLMSAVEEARQAKESSYERRERVR